LSRLCLLAAGSPPMMQTLARHQELLDMLFDPDEIERPAAREMLITRICERLRPARTEDARVRALGAFWRRERLRVAARSLWGQAPDAATVGEELTDVAEAMLHGLLQAAAERAGAADALPRFAVIGLGKFGGRELNFPSDGDLLYVHERPDDATAAIAIADALRQIMERLRREQNVDMEFDPRLRPNGRFGVLSRTPNEYAAYYRDEAAVWERQTLLKARFVGGSEVLAERWFALARDPAVYAASPTDAQIEAVRAMKQRIENERLRPAERHTDIKLGLGAMSDIEWIAQLLQWRHGARGVPTVRVPGTRAALHALGGAGLLARDDLLVLSETYDLLQRLRNAGYLRTGLPADVLPAAGSPRNRQQGQRRRRAPPWRTRPLRPATGQRRQRRGPDTGGPAARRTCRAYRGCARCFPPPVFGRKNGMNAVTAAAVLLPAAFVLGAIPFGYLAGRMRGVDLRAHGSGNIGATNVLRVLGTGPGLMVLALDVLKGWLPIAACRSLLVSSGGEIVSSAGGWLLVGTGLAAILGHTFSPFLRFQGGKGVATSMGVLLGLSPLVAGLSCLAFVLVVALTRYVSLGSMLAAVTQATLFWLPLAGAGSGNNGARFPTAFGLFRPARGGFRPRQAPFQYRAPAGRHGKPLRSQAAPAAGPRFRTGTPKSKHFVSAGRGNVWPGPIFRYKTTCVCSQPKASQLISIGPPSRRRRRPT
jgi:acyl-phosphate glycerol 3-phosphate acyltransferase